MHVFSRILCFLILFLLVSCKSEKKQAVTTTQHIFKIKKPSVIVDCNYTFEEAITGSKAPAEILEQLQLINVQYYSTDGKIHQGQILTNYKMAHKLEMLFRFMKQLKFPVAHAIPIVRYSWSDNLSMQANNTYSFCYRNPGYSKHALGMAVDINPFFNPLRWKGMYIYRRNKPAGASYNQSVPGTFFNSSPVVLEFKKNGLRWGHTFSRNYDDHHFEM